MYVLATTHMKQDKMEVMASTKGKDKVSFNGYMYWLDHHAQYRVT